jgi:YhcH/YjgK/YiaL family protein
MALFGTLQTLRAQLRNDPHFRASLDYLEECVRPGAAAFQRIGRITEGVTERVDLAGGAFGLEQVYRSKPRSEGFFESHRAYIDVQCIVEGEEFIEVLDISKLRLKEDRTPEKDVLIYDVPNETTTLRLGAGDAAILFPVDGHMPQILAGTSRLVRKVVVKVPVL